jgi:hypothetical protein
MALDPEEPIAFIEKADASSTTIILWEKLERYYASMDSIGAARTARPRTTTGRQGAVGRCYDYGRPAGLTEATGPFGIAFNRCDTTVEHF